MKEVREWLHEPTGNFWRHPVGRIITVALNGLTANTPKMESIFTAGSVGSLVVFSVVKLATYRPIKDTSGRKFNPLLGTVLCLVALVTLVMPHYGTEEAWARLAVGMVGACFPVECRFERLGAAAGAVQERKSNVRERPNRRLVTSHRPSLTLKSSRALSR